MRFDISALFNPKARPLLGMDISSSAVKLVELTANGKDGYRVERYTIEVLPKDAVSDGNIANLDGVVDCVKRAWKRMGTSTRNVAMALPGSAVITKKIIVPAGLRDDELESQVETEANQYIPFAIDEVDAVGEVVEQRPEQLGLEGHHAPPGPDSATILHGSPRTGRRPRGRLLTVVSDDAADRPIAHRAERLVALGEHDAVERRPVQPLRRVAGTLEGAHRAREGARGEERVDLAGVLERHRLALRLQPLDLRGGSSGAHRRRDAPPL